MNKGDMVLIKSVRGEPGIRRVWDPAPERPFVCLEEYWLRWQANGTEPICWHVSRDQVYQADEKLAGQIDEAIRASKAGDAGASARVEALWKKAKRAV